MAQRGVMTARNPNVSYRSATAPLDEARDSGSEGAFDSGAPELGGQRFPGWLRVVIILGGAALSWVAVAIAMGWLR